MPSTEAAQHYIYLAFAKGLDQHFLGAFLQQDMHARTVLLDPPPFVRQTALNDYYVAYDLNAFTDAPALMTKTYSQLHQNIQDKCNEAGIEILSPAYTALRDGNSSTIPKHDA